MNQFFYRQSAKEKIKECVMSKVLINLVKVWLILSLATECTSPANTSIPTQISSTSTTASAAIVLSADSTSSASSVTPTDHMLTRTVTSGDYQYVMECRGEGNPTVLLLGGRATAWKPIQAEINRSVRTCVFDHLGSSTTPLTAEQIAKNVHLLLNEGGMTSPYVLVGFSIGGYIARLYANLYPEEVAGMVLLDSSHEDQNARFLAALPPETPDECQELKGYRAELQGPHMIPIGPEITLDFDVSADEVRAIEQDLGKLPFVVLTAGRSEWPDCFPTEARENLDQAWLEIQNDLASLSVNSTHLVAKESGHNFAEQPEMVIDAIRQVVNNVRTGAGGSAP